MGEDDEKGDYKALKPAPDAASSFCTGDGRGDGRGDGEKDFTVLARIFGAESLASPEAQKDHF